MFRPAWHLRYVTGIEKRRTWLNHLARTAFNWCRINLVIGAIYDHGTHWRMGVVEESKKISVLGSGYPVDTFFVLDNDPRWQQRSRFPPKSLGLKGWARASQISSLALAVGILRLGPGSARAFQGRAQAQPGLKPDLGDHYSRGSARKLVMGMAWHGLKAVALAWLALALAAKS
ncbi:hypothetical protein JB92DRAFT_3101795 [Gautieria morchelliformis]|nr:hypothetical protein JB92DRAFT_3101795 [Gautieria morchelliformis]